VRLRARARARARARRAQVGWFSPQVGGSGAVVDALVRGIERNGGRVRTSTHVERINVEAGRAVNPNPNPNP
jgi:phytoene dehydrogenase-like protein